MLRTKCPETYTGRTKEKKPKNSTGAEDPAAYNDAPDASSPTVRPQWRESKYWADQKREPPWTVSVLGHSSARSRGRMNVF